PIRGVLLVSSGQALWRRAGWSWWATGGGGGRTSRARDGPVVRPGSVTVACDAGVSAVAGGLPGGGGVSGARVRAAANNSPSAMGAWVASRDQPTSPALRSTAEAAASTSRKLASTGT